MKHGRSWLADGVVGLSAVVFVISAVMWVRSYFVCDRFPNFTAVAGKAGVRIDSWQGMIFIMRFEDAVPNGVLFMETPTIESHRVPVQPVSIPMNGNYVIIHGPSITLYGLGRHNFGFQGATFQTGTSAGTVGFSVREIPYWLFVVVGSVAPVWKLWIWRRRRRIVAKGLCVVCGYDLRETPERCPECGTVPARREIVST